MSTRTDAGVAAAVLCGTVVAAVYDRRSIDPGAPPVIDRRYCGPIEDGRCCTSASSFV